MSGSAIFALVVIGLIVATLAVFLIRVVPTLHTVIDTLGKVVFVTDINRNLSTVAEALEAEVAEATGKGAAAAMAPQASEPSAPAPPPPPAAPTTAAPARVAVSKRASVATKPPKGGIYRSLRDPPPDS